jgi:asparagine synthase (glutamine-hydrolysing)
MCAIAGVLNFNTDEPVDRDVLLSMRDSMKHRGPDDCGVYVNGPVGLASRRLSIIDLESGHQPLYNEDKSICLVINGEIYNFKSLRQDLETRGHTFQTMSDAEVVVHAYEQFGLDCLEAIEGMFAFALWDERKQKLILARDRMGEKPLHYYLGPAALVFGSELKSLFLHPSVPRDIDHNSLSKYLTLQYVPAPDTIFRQVRKLLPGHYLTLSPRGDCRETQYWDIPAPSKHEFLPPVDFADEQFVSLLRASVRAQLASDVPIGVLLSGGLDSTLVATFAAECLPGIPAFTMAFEDPTFDESRQASLLARRIGCDHHVEVCRGADMRDLLPEVLVTMDEPLADASILATYLLTRFASKSVKVALSGDGGDELFAGYPTFQALRLRSAFRKFPEFVRRVGAAAVGKLPVSDKYLSLDFKLRQFLRGVDGSVVEDFSYWMGAFTRREKQTLLNDQVLEGLNETDLIEDLNTIRGFDDDVQKCLYFAAKHYLQDGVLVKTDRAGMANSLEVRAPFLGRGLVEFAAWCPLEYKMTMRQTKWIMRHAARGILPGEILWAKKKGFGVPISRWIRGELRELFGDMLEPTRIERGNVFNPAEVQRLLEGHWSRRENNSRLLWTLLVFELWRES